MNEGSHKVDPRMFPTVADLRLEGSQPPITTRTIATNMLCHYEVVFVHASQLVIAFVVLAARLVLCPLLQFLRMRHRQFELPRIGPDAMHLCPKASRHRQRREFLDRRLRSPHCGADLRNEPAPDMRSNSPGKLDLNAWIAGPSVRPMSSATEATGCMDLAKLQSSTFLEMTILGYAYALCSAMTNIDRQQGFAMPIPPDALAALRGIVHARVLDKQEGATRLKCAQPDT